MPPIEKDFQTSFIPKKPLAQDRVSREKPISILNVIATIIFFASLSVGVVFYFYKLSLADSIEKMANDLERAQAAFEPTLIYELETLDRRITASQEILDRHISVTPIMSGLSAITLKSVQFTDFDFGVGTDNKNIIEVTLKGKAKSYTAIALQAEELKKQPAFIDPIFSNLSLDTKGNVVFDLNFEVDPAFVSYDIDGESTTTTSTVTSGITQ